MCLCVHLSLQPHTDFHLFDLWCHNIWTRGPNLSCTNPAANNTSWNTFRCPMTPGSNTHTRTNIHTSFVINTRHIHQIKQDMESWPRPHNTFAQFYFLTASKLLHNVICFVPEWKPTLSCYRANVFHLTFTQLGFFTEESWAHSNWLTYLKKRHINKRMFLVLSGGIWHWGFLCFT